MPTERKFAISTTPGQPGYEATYSTLNAWENAVGPLDLVTLDQNIVLEIFDDYGGTTYNLTALFDLRNWVGNDLTGHVVEIVPVAGSEFVYGPNTGSKIWSSNTTVNFARFTSASPCPLNLRDLGYFQQGPGTAPWLRDNDANNCVVDRCFIEYGERLGAPAFKRFTNNVVSYVGTASQRIFDGTRTNQVVSANTMIGQNGSTCRALWRRVGISGTPACFNNVGLLDGTASTTEGIFLECFGSNCASTDGTASLVGAGGFDNIVITDEFNSVDDLHLLETSQLRGAGANLFGNGYDKDIDRDDRPNAAWDIGADQFVGVAPTGPTQNAIFQGFNV